MNILAAALVQIIGLAVLRNDCEMEGMHVVLPSVVTESSHVEPHSAILVFKDDARVGWWFENNWQSFPLKPMPGYSYVNLNGQRIRFIVNGNNEPAEIPVGLPHLKNSCPPLMDELSAGYQPPGYSAAAAVVMIPKGVASACRNPNERIDTRVRMNNSGNYKVVAGNKRITLRDNAVVMIVNLPTAWVKGVEGKTKPSELHSEVYFHMALLAPEARHECELQRSQNVDPCNSAWADVPVARRRGLFFRWMRSDAPQTPQSLDPGTTFECSNTQWP